MSVLRRLRCIMAKAQHSNPLDQQFGDKSLREWEASWKRLPGGFKEKHPELNQVGLARAVLNGEVMYIL